MCRRFISYVTGTNEAGVCINFICMVVPKADGNAGFVYKLGGNSFKDRAFRHLRIL